MRATSPTAGLTSPSHESLSKMLANMRNGQGSGFRANGSGNTRRRATMAGFTHGVIANGFRL